MHAAPSVNYPVGRSAFAGRLGAVLVALGLAAAVAWTWQADDLGWRQLLAFSSVLLCAALGLHAWLRASAGTLQWDGSGWTWQQGAHAESGQPEPALDLQARLLLRWRADGGRARWLWAEQESASADWEALRRAVYSRANAPAPTFPRKGKEGLSAGKPPAAEQ